MIAVVDYGAGNIRSMCEALARAKADFKITSVPEDLYKADRVIIPGVGEAANAMKQLKALGIDKAISDLKIPVLGICIGMQLFCRRSEEGDTHCLGIFHTDVTRLKSDDPLTKIPHMGWDTLENVNGPLFDGIEDNAWVYYVHSFAAGLCDETCATTKYCREFSAALQNGNFFGVQFHPEKSAETGAKIINNFLNIKL